MTPRVTRRCAAPAAVIVGNLPAHSPRFRFGGLLAAAIGVLAAVLLPFAPVSARSTTVAWPAAGQPAASTTALLVPYRPSELAVDLPCRTLAVSDVPATVFSTGNSAKGLTVTARPDGASLTVGGHDYPLPVTAEAAGCRVEIRADEHGMSVMGGDGSTLRIDGLPVPQVFGFLTDLDTATARGISASAVARSPFATSPTLLKWVLVATQLACAGYALRVLGVRFRGRRVRPLPGVRPQATWWVDLGVIATLAGWAVIGPVSVDDGWATTIARTFAATGSPGNYYRWWNASEVPFALSQQILSVFTEVSLAPLWLRLPSTALGVVTWFALSRGVLPAALHARARTIGVRVLAAALLVAAWLPYDLGTRPEGYVAAGVMAVTALLWRSRGPAGIGLATLVAAITVAVSPTAVLLVGPLVVLSSRAMSALRRNVVDRRELITRVAAVACLAAVALTVIFADQTWDAVVTASDWHAFFGPTLPWSAEPDRYRHLLGDDQQGSFAKRVPILLSAAWLAIVAFRWRRSSSSSTDVAALRLAAMVVVSLAALCVVPSKWSYHLGAAAGLLAAFVTVAVVSSLSGVRSHVTRHAVASVAAGVLCACAAALAFRGPNAWWLSTAYDVPWSSGPIRPLGLPLDSPVPWAVLAIVGGLACAWRAAPTIVTMTALGTALLVLVGSFVAAPLRRPEGSLALANLTRLHDPRSCGLADDVEVLPDGPPLEPVTDDGRYDGFTPMTGYALGAPPPDPPGVGTSRYLWGSRSAGRDRPRSITTPWFALPPLGPADGVTVSVQGRTDDGSALSFEFGRSTPDGVIPLGDAAPADRVAVDEIARFPLWRSIGLDAKDFPAGSDRVRIHAVDDRSDEFGWLAFTGPRMRSIVPLDDFLAQHQPVLVAWPQSFLFPCVLDTPRVADGLAQTPMAVVESPRPFFVEDRDPNIGGSFAAVDELEALQEIPSRLIGHPDVDWGSVRLVSTTIDHDRYDVTVSDTVVPGAGGLQSPPPERP